jgi:hypothetical protein
MKGNMESKETEANKPKLETVKRVPKDDLELKTLKEVTRYLIRSSLLPDGYEEVPLRKGGKPGV